MCSAQGSELESRAPHRQTRKEAGLLSKNLSLKSTGMEGLIITNKN
jgi:hypothetical protein